MACDKLVWTTLLNGCIAIEFIGYDSGFACIRRFKESRNQWAEKSDPKPQTNGKQDGTYHECPFMLDSEYIIYSRQRRSLEVWGLSLSSSNYQPIKQSELQFKVWHRTPLIPEVLHSGRHYYQRYYTPDAILQEYSTKIYINAVQRCGTGSLFPPFCNHWNITCIRRARLTAALEYTSRRLGYLDLLARFLRNS